MITMIVVLLILAVSVANALEPTKSVKPKIEEPIDDKIKTVLSNYIQQIPDIEEKYVIDERISRAINRYFNGKISTFPLLRVSLKIDRNPVKIPWTLEQTDVKEQDSQLNKMRVKNKRVRKQYKLEYEHTTSPSTSKLNAKQ